MATLPALVSVEDYERDYINRDTKPMCEYVEGILILKDVGTFLTLERKRGWPHSFRDWDSKYSWNCTVGFARRNSAFPTVFS